MNDIEPPGPLSAGSAQRTLYIVRPDVQSATEQIAAMRARLARMHDTELPEQEIEDALCDGYAQALTGDAWLTQTENRLHDLIDDMSVPVRGREVRAIAHEHAAFQRSVIALRYELEGLRQERRRRRPRSHAG